MEDEFSETIWQQAMDRFKKTHLSKYAYCIHLKDGLWWVGEPLEHTGVWVRKPTTIEKELGFELIKGFSVDRLNWNGFKDRKSAVKFARRLGYKPK